MQRQLRHLGKRDVLAHQVLIDHPPIETVQRVAARRDPGRDAAPGRDVAGLGQKLAIGRQAAEPLDQLIAAIRRRLDPDRVRQAHPANGFDQLGQLVIGGRATVADQLLRVDRLQRDQIGDQPRPLQPHMFLRQRVVFGADLRLDLRAVARRGGGFADRRGHRPPARLDLPRGEALRASRRAPLRVGRPVGSLVGSPVGGPAGRIGAQIGGQLDVEHAALAAHWASSSCVQAARTWPRNSS